MSKIVAIVLAGQPSPYLDEPRQLVDWGGRPLLVHLIEEARRLSVSDIYVVLGGQAELLLHEVEFDDAVVVINDDWEEGIGSCLRVGLDACTRSPGIGAALVVAADRTTVGTAAPELLVKHREADVKVVAPRYRYSLDYPLLIHRGLWARFMAMSGAADPIDLLRAHPEWVEEVRIDALPPRRIATPGDVEELRPRAGAT